MQNETPMIQPVVLYEGPDEDDREYAKYVGRDPHPPLVFEEPVTVQEFLKGTTKWIRDVSETDDERRDIEDDHVLLDDILLNVIQVLSKALGSDAKKLIEAYNNVYMWYA